MLRVTGLFIYPVKSLRGFAVPAAEVDARGFAGDRRFLVVDRDNRFLTQRVLPRMALIETALTVRDLVLTASGHGSISVPRDSSSAGPSTLDPRPSTVRVTVWKDTVTAEDCGDEPAAWLSAFLGQTCRLVRAGGAYSRPIPARKIPAGLDYPSDIGPAAGARPSSLDPRLSPPGPRPSTLDSDGPALDSRPSTLDSSHEVSFADGFPFLLIGEESLADLNARLAAPLPMNRFRPGLVVAGAAPYAEDGWARFRIGGVVFHGATRCGRCVVTTTDQLTAERAPEPLRTLATYRREADGSVMFGRNLVHETKAGSVAVGDAVEML